MIVLLLSKRWFEKRWKREWRTNSWYSTEYSAPRNSKRVTFIDFWKQHCILVWLTQLSTGKISWVLTLLLSSYPSPVTGSLGKKRWRWTKVRVHHLPVIILLSSRWREVERGKREGTYKCMMFQEQVFIVNNWCVHRTHCARDEKFSWKREIEDGKLTWENGKSQQAEFRVYNDDQSWDETCDWITFF